MYETNAEPSARQREPRIPGRGRETFPDRRYSAPAVLPLWHAPNRNQKRKRASSRWKSARCPISTERDRNLRIAPSRFASTRKNLGEYNRRSSPHSGEPKIEFAQESRHFAQP